ncbi:MAG: M15 family metallopeptidase [Lachnospiraceae bacterium]|nr:M15 family metallopeptidase [Lachnospiraceae bacterium]
MLNDPIPVRENPDFGFKYDDIEDCGEGLVSLQNLGIICEPYYYNCGIKYAVNDCLVRESVADKLVMVIDRLLPSHCTLRVYDGWRPFIVQQELWEEYRLIIKNENPSFTDEDVDFFTSMFVDKPSINTSDPFLHSTGGAVDLTVCYRDGSPLEFGSDYDNFTPKAYSYYFEEKYEEHGYNNVAQYNRRLLYNAMTSVGFTSLPTEWWHFDYGNRNWAYYTGNVPIYKGILDTKEGV